jgi:outer membrane protein TolC
MRGSDEFLSIRRARAPGLLLAGVLLSAPAVAQPLTLADAVGRAARHNPSIVAARAAEAEARERVAQARAAYLPRVDLVESAQRGNQPVYAFGSLLSQRRFTEANFAIGELNHPDPIGNFRAAVTIDQIVFDRSQAWWRLRASRADAEIAATASAHRAAAIAQETTTLYGAVLAAAAARRTVARAIEAAEADLARAGERRDAGVLPEADVLALRVHLAELREREIRAGTDERLARAGLNRIMGDPLDAVRDLQLPEPPAEAPPLAELERQALEQRPELAQSAIGLRLAGDQRRAARGAFLPQVAVRGMYELNGASFDERAGSWLVGAELRWNLFAGLADLARTREAAHARTRAQAIADELRGAIALDVRRAAGDLESARAREVVAREATAHARESERMIRDRYEAGLASVTDLLRAAAAALQAEAQQTTARVDVVVAVAALDRAIGRQP